ncbi:acyl carrier protein [Fusobacterium nucleatum]|jgi:phosphopantetheine-binding|uniref:acyl carrier protein n=1 Tax=Fusobacterium nucleatum TaxID=851 RepID=UPI00355BFD55
MNKQEIIQKVTEIIQKESELEVVIKINDDLANLGINSLNFIRMIVRLEEAFNIEFPDEALEYDKFNTILEIATYIDNFLLNN